ncbi:hypothetical protein [Clostridiisalibacter paucivorans]|uniref:hypothetical protein n=1 Tax=Clostridiisalibacter paucivorans TaxID=408753 RepID=UPI000479E15F|nr:hypothetical protein [Clostridiisalibacter paucivorans]
MSTNDIFSNLIVENLELESDIQKILLCKDKDFSKYYIVNAISEKRVLDPVNIDKLVDQGLALEIKDTEEYVYIISEYKEGIRLKDYIKKEESLLSKKIEYTSFVFDIIWEHRYLTPHLMCALLSPNNFLISEGEIVNRGVLNIQEDYEYMKISDVLTKVGHLMNVIYTGEELYSDELDSSIPPDIQRILKKCLSSGYSNYEELIDDFHSSQIYRFMNNRYEESREDSKVKIELYTKYEERTGVNKKKIGLIILTMLLLISAIVLGTGDIFDKFNINSRIDKDTALENDGKREKDREIFSIEDKEKLESESGVAIGQSQMEGLYNFYDEKLIKKSEGENLGQLDGTKYYKGNTSVKVSNGENIEKDYVIAGIDLTNEFFESLAGRNVDISFWVNSKQGKEASVLIKLYSKDKLVSQKIKKIYVPESMWTLYSVNLDIGKADYIKIYLTDWANGDIWFDNFDVDVLK